jgi:hypothetical protein
VEGSGLTKRGRVSAKEGERIQAGVREPLAPRYIRP